MVSCTTEWCVMLIETSCHALATSHKLAIHFKTHRLLQTLPQNWGWERYHSLGEALVQIPYTVITPYLVLNFQCSSEYACHKLSYHRKNLGMDSEVYKTFWWGSLTLHSHDHHMKLKVFITQKHRSLPPHFVHFLKDFRHNKERDKAGPFQFT